MAAYDISALSSAHEFDTSNGTFNTGIKIDSTHALHAWTGTDLDGFMQVVTLNTGTGAVTSEGTPLEFDTSEHSGGSFSKLDSNHFLYVWSGSTGSATTRAQVFTVNLSTWAVTAEGSILAVSTSAASAPALTKLSTDKFVISFYAAGITYVQVLSVNTSTWAVTEPESALQVALSASSEEKTMALATIAADRFILFWAGSASDGFVRTYSVNTSTWAITAVDSTVEYDTVNGTYPFCIQVQDAFHYLNAWSGSVDDGYIQVFTVNNSTYAVTATGSALEFDTTNGQHMYIAQLDENHFAVTWAGDGSDGYARVFEVNLTTWAVTAVGTAALEFDTTNGTYTSCVYMGDNFLLIFWAGIFTDGYVQAFDVDIPAVGGTAVKDAISFGMIAFPR